MSIKYEGGYAFTEGELKGFNDSGVPVSQRKKFLMDTGALVSAIDESNAKSFKYEVIGGTATNVFGQSLQVGRCIAMRFRRRPVPAGPGSPPESETEEWVECHRPFVLVHNLGFSLLGMDQLEATGSNLYLDPPKKHGQIGKAP